VIEGEACDLEETLPGGTQSLPRISHLTLISLHTNQSLVPLLLLLLTLAEVALGRGYAHTHTHSRSFVVACAC
jgi:hypothetical protein